MAVAKSSEQQRARSRLYVKRCRERKKGDVTVISLAVPNSYLLALVDAGYLEDDYALGDREAVRRAVEASLATSRPEPEKYDAAVRVLRRALSLDGKIPPDR